MKTTSKILQIIINILFFDPMFCSLLYNGIKFQYRFLLIMIYTEQWITYGQKTSLIGLFIIEIYLSSFKSHSMDRKTRH